MLLVFCIVGLSTFNPSLLMYYCTPRASVFALLPTLQNPSRFLKCCSSFALWVCRPSTLRCSCTTVHLAPRFLLFFPHYKILHGFLNVARLLHCGFVDLQPFVAHVLLYTSRLGFCSSSHTTKSFTVS